MEDFLRKLLAEYHILKDNFTDKTITKVIQNEEIKELIKSISQQKKQIINQFKMYHQTEIFLEKYIPITNANIILYVKSKVIFIIQYL